MTAPGPDDAPDPRTGTPAIRASDAEREAAMTTLRDAATAGRLTFEELADRLDAAARARTRDELATLASDLPADEATVPAAGERPSVPEVVERRSVVGDIEVRGPWRVPARSRFSTVFGDIELDLREATVSGGRVEVDAGSVFGDVRLLVPEGVRVDVRARMGLGSTRQQAGTDAPPGAPVVVLTGGTWFGDVRVDVRRLRERLAARLLGR